MRRFTPLLILGLALIAGCGGSSSSNSSVASAPTITSPPLSSSVKGKLAQAKPQLGSPSQVRKSGGGAGSAQAFGSEAPAAKRAAAARVLTVYLGSLSSGDTATACALLSPIFAQHLALIASHGQPNSGGGCPAALAKILPRLPADRRHLANPTVLSLRLSGPHAIAIFTATANKPYSMPMLKSGPDWKVATIVLAQLSG
jgi:hypothetical protein